ncbi:MAG: hypothetical protein IH788_00810, partial [Nitrospinae bacterium]|nr:hypothetical protein [Nitrospinota bacterium]
MAGKLNEDKDFQAANEAFEKGRFAEAMELQKTDPDRYITESMRTMGDHVRAMLELQEDDALQGAIDIMSKPAFAQRTEALEPLAGDIVTRLRLRAEQDPQTARGSLVNVLGAIGTFHDIDAALNDIKEHLE